MYNSFIRNVWNQQNLVIFSLICITRYLCSSSHSTQYLSRFPMFVRILPQHFGDVQQHSNLSDVNSTCTSAFRNPKNTKCRRLRFGDFGDHCTRCRLLFLRRGTSRDWFHTSRTHAYSSHCAVKVIQIFSAVWLLITRYIGRCL